MSQGASPWSSDDVAVRSGELQLDWASIQRESSDVPPEPRGKALRRAAICLAAIGTAFALVVTWPLGRDARSEPIEPAPLPALEQLPALTTTTVAPPTTRRPIDVEPSATPASVAVPQPVLDVGIESELVALGMDGALHTVSLPSGRVESIDVGVNGFFGGDLVVSADATLISSFGRGVTVVGRDGTIRAIPDDLLANDTTGLGPVITIDGRLDDGEGSSFLLTIRDRSTGEQHRVLIAGDGAVEEVAGPVPAHLGGAIRSNGTELRNEAGGVYAIRPDGPDRLATGWAIAATDTHALVRWCDSELDCTTSLVDVESGETTAIDLDTAIPTTHISLSPDAAAVSFTRYGMSNERVLVGLDGSSAVEPVRVDNDDAAAWSLDSSGEFIVPRRTGLVFVELGSGEAHPFAEQLGPIAAIGIRPLSS